MLRACRVTVLRSARVQCCLHFLAYLVKQLLWCMLEYLLCLQGHVNMLPMLPLLPFPPTMPNVGIPAIPVNATPEQQTQHHAAAAAAVDSTSPPRGKTGGIDDPASSN